MIVLIPCFILALIGLRMNVQRVKMVKYSNTLSWIITLVFGLVLFGIFFDGGDIEMLMYGLFMTSEMITIAVIEAVILLVLNVLTAENKVKAVILSIMQVSASICLMAFIVLLVISIFFGGGSSVKQLWNKVKPRTYEEDQYAKANGYFDAQSANEKGFDTSEANNPGFDYTSKK